MSSEKVEGTIQFEGMLQGRLPAAPEFPNQLREWVAFLQELGVAFHADISDAAFNLLPEPEAVSIAKLGDPPEQAIQQAIEQLIEQFPSDDPAQLSSTLRSREFRHNEEVQTFYGISGRLVRPQTRTVEAQTVRPPEPITTQQRVQMGLVGLGMAVLMFGIALLFPGFRALFSHAVETVRPVDLKAIKIDPGPYATYVTHTVDEQKSGWGGVTIVLKRTKQYPLTDADLKTAVAESGDNLRQRMALESLVRGYVWIDLFDPDGNLLSHREQRVADLNSHESVEFLISFPAGVRVTQIVLVP